MLSSLFFVLTFQSVAQDIPLGTWRTHLSYQQARHLVFGDNKIFCAAENGFFYYDLEDNSLNVLSKISGLSDVGITAMNYHSPSRTLVAAYSSGGIDLITKAGVHTLSDYKNSDLVANKQIPEIVFRGNRALVATTLGVIVISLDQHEIVENYRSIGQNGDDVPVSSLYLKGDTLFAITPQGIQSGLVHQNLLDFNNWMGYEETSDGAYAYFGVLDEKLYCIKNDTVLMHLQNGLWEELGVTFPEEVVAVRESENLLIATSGEISQFNGQVVTTVVQLENGIRLNDFIYALDEYWLATEDLGLVRQGSGQSLIPNGPDSDRPGNLKIIDGNLYSFYAPAAESYDGNIEIMGYNIFKNGLWSYEDIEGFPNITDVAKWNNQLFFSSIGFGLYNAATEMVMDHTNSSLTNSKAGLGVMIPTLESSDVLWMSSYRNTHPVATLDTEGEIRNYTQEAIGSDANTTLTLTENGLALLTVAGVNGGGFIAFDKSGSISRLFTVASDLPSTEISNIDVDLLDNAWVATSRGIISYPNASLLLDFSQPIAPIYENETLFEDDDILFVKTDGGNRVWMSTNEGLWVFEKDFSDIVHFFTAENSPLPSNNIRKMVYNSLNGEMFIQSDKGMVSFRSTSSKGSSDYERVAIFPNPVRPGFAGLVGISGLIYDTKVKITDINGKLIRELETEGGTTAWDLLDYNNQRVSSGVYIILTAFRDGSDKFVGKIAVIN